MELYSNTSGVYHGHCVELQPMPHEVHVRHHGEDWAGITNQKLRKKLQNRLNKRVSRERKRRKRFADDSSDAVSCRTDSTDNISPDDTPAPFPVQNAMAPLSRGIIVSMFSHCTVEDAKQKRAMLERFAQQALVNYMTADPCADHYLSIIQYNTINGLTRNAAALGYQFDWLICAVISPFGYDGQSHDSMSTYVTAVPSSLVPTSMQLTTKHHPWLDLFPFPEIRDNLLIATNVLSPEDEQRLFDDIMESRGVKDEWSGLLVWGEPWEQQSWEVTVPFLQRWGWLVRGCPEIIKSTNRWRSHRGEKPIQTPGFVYDED